MFPARTEGGVGSGKGESREGRSGSSRFRKRSRVVLCPDDDCQSVFSPLLTQRAARVGA